MFSVVCSVQPMAVPMVMAMAIAEAMVIGMVMVVDMFLAFPNQDALEGFLIQGNKKLAQRDTN